MAHRKRPPKQQDGDPVEKAVLGAIALVIGIAGVVIIISYVWESLVENLPWNVW